MSLDDEVIQYVSGKVDIDKEKLSRNSKFVEDLGMDSLDRTDMLMEFEKKYSINIPDQDFGKMRTIGDVVDYIKGHYRGNGETGVKAP